MSEFVNGKLEFSENDREWQAVPSWVNFLIQLGYRLPIRVSTERRIILVSMPCDSAGAGLVALGCLIRNLGDESANIIDGHYQSLLRHARQYLSACKSCELSKCLPSRKKCGYIKKVNGKVRSNRSSRKYHEFSSSTSLKKQELAWQSRGRGRSGPVTFYPSPEYAVNWQVKGLPHVQTQESGNALDGDIYQGLVPDAEVLDENLRRTHFGLCLAGRALGAKSTKDAYSRVAFRVNSRTESLERLLTIKGWSGGLELSRMLYFNSRTDGFEPKVAEPECVVADGDSSFLKALAKKEFQNSNVIGVVHRILHRDRLEEIGNRLLGLRQWYEEDDETFGLTPQSGIRLAGFKRAVQK